jgi:hypothetical protein
VKRRSIKNETKMREIGRGPQRMDAAVECEARLANEYREYTRP